MARESRSAVTDEQDVAVSAAAVDGEAEGGVADDQQWYVIHTYSGYENKVKTNLEHRIESMGVQDKIFQVVIPTEEEIEIKDGQGVARTWILTRSTAATWGSSGR